MVSKKIKTIFVATILLISVFSAVSILKASGEEANTKSIGKSTSKTVEDVEFNQTSNISIPNITIPEPTA